VIKIFFRYLFLRLLLPFCYCVAGLSILWVVADVYGTMEDFIEHKVKLVLFLKFYALQFPRMLVQVLPAAVLFSTLFTLLSLKRRSELVALQAGGLAPLALLAPFLLFGAVNAVLLFYDMSGPAPAAGVTRDRIMQEVRGKGTGANEFINLPYIDEVNHRAWFFQDLKVGRAGDAKATGIEIVQQDPDNHDISNIVANEGRWTGQFWRLTGAKRVTYTVDGAVQSQEHFSEYDLSDVTTPPQQLALIASQPEDLTLAQLSEYIASSTQSPQMVAKYRTEWWDRLLHPFSVIVLMLYALVQSGRNDRRSPAAGVGIAIGVLIGFSVLSSVFLSAGRFDRLPAFLAASATEWLFLAVALHWLAVNNGWYWQIQEWYRDWRADESAAGRRV
jgi:lipopolysaccharide export system permease protein